MADNAKVFNFSYLELLLQHFSTCQTSFLDTQDKESVHQLRVVSRKLRIALWAYSFLWDNKKYKRYKKKIANFSRVLSPSRDIDVFVEFLQGVSRARPRGCDDLINLLVTEKRREQVNINKSIIRQLRHLKREKILLKIKYLILEADLKELHIFLEAKLKIKKRFRKVCQFKKYANRINCVDKLHTLRIANKNLRYTLESFKCLSNKKIQLALKPLNKAHDLLGLIHDYDSWENCFRNMLKENTYHRMQRCLKILQDICHSKKRSQYLKLIVLLKKNKGNLWTARSMFDVV